MNVSIRHCLVAVFSTFLIGACQSAAVAPAPAPAPAPAAAAPEGCTVDFPADAPRLDLAPTRAPPQTDDAKGRPYQFATAISVRKELTRLGRWTEFSDGWSSLYLRLSSPGARSLSVHLSQVLLPARAQIWLCSADGKVRQGPYREAAGGELWTPVVPGDAAGIEVQVPTAAKAQFAAQLAEVFGAFR